MSLFSKTIIEREAMPYVREVNIHEHKAPTDESVNLLNELQDKAINNVVKTINITDNTLNGTVVYRVAGIDMDKYRYVTRFSFNGKEHKLEGEINRYELLDHHKYGSHSVYVAFAKSICVLFAEHVINDPDVVKLIRQIL